ncbi:hypothetical protein [Mycolicibacterium wolinskyi]|uniref:hypothetical protein n=1 Tax=Mycolicibacterium wolinskyi TaxID=59750 RepID=UPI0039178251
MSETTIEHQRDEKAEAWNDLFDMRVLADAIEREADRVGAASLPPLGNAESLRLDEALLAAQFLWYYDGAWTGESSCAAAAGMVAR